MPLICYQDKNFRSDKLALIDKINSVIEEYQRQGYSLTLRQCYYQLVARGIIENNERSYKNTGNLINDARLAGLIDWNAIEDRTRNLKRLSHWSNPQSIIESASDQYMKDTWQGQDYYVEVWVEKEALANVVGRISDEMYLISAVEVMYHSLKCGVLVRDSLHSKKRERWLLSFI